MNVQCLNIGEAVYKILTEDETVSALVGNHVYPVVAPEGTQFPYVVYSCMSMSTASDKDSYFYQQDVIEGIFICTDKYQDGIDIAMAVTEAMQFDDLSVEVGDGEINIMESRFDSRTEDYVSNTFVQGLTIHLKIR